MGIQHQFHETHEELPAGGLGGALAAGDLEAEHTLDGTQACYIKTASDESKAAMQKLESALSDTNVTPKRLAVMRPASA
jgi:hypothetical protein